MSEQPGKAAGTAEPNEPSVPLNNFNKPWRIDLRDPAMILDRDGIALAPVLAAIVGTSQFRPTAEIKAIAQHIVACVNFCSNLDPELLDALSGGAFRITCQRIDPVFAAELADNSKQFHADHADKPVAVLTGGAI